MLYLSYRARSEKEIRQNLRKHEIPEEVIEETLERLSKVGLANDNKFAQTWVENRNTFRPRSRRALTMELRQKGLDDEIVHSAVSGWTRMLWPMKQPKKDWAGSKVWNGTISAKSYLSFSRDGVFPTPSLHPRSPDLERDTYAQTRKILKMRIYHEPA